MVYWCPEAAEALVTISNWCACPVTSILWPVPMINWCLEVGVAPVTNDIKNACPSSGAHHRQVPVHREGAGRYFTVPVITINPRLTAAVLI